MICALILSLCGVDDDVVAHEYNLTNLGLKCRHEEIISHLRNEEAFKDDPDGARRMVMARYVLSSQYTFLDPCSIKTYTLAYWHGIVSLYQPKTGADAFTRKGNMSSTLSWIRKTYGSAEKCVVELGLLTPEAVERLKRNLIVDAPSTGPVDWQAHAKLIAKEELAL